MIGEIDEIYKPGEAKDQAAKAALARKLLEDGRMNTANRAEQFVLLRRAGEIARDAGEADLMLEAVDAIVAAGFDVQPFKVKARLLKQLVAQSALRGDSQLSAINASCVKFAEEAAASGAVEEALDVLDAARRSLARPIIQAHAAVRAAKAALARARTPAEKAERETKSIMRIKKWRRLRPHSRPWPNAPRASNSLGTSTRQFRQPKSDSRPRPTTPRLAWRSAVGTASSRAIGTRALNS